MAQSNRSIDPRSKLLHYLDQHAFEPVRNAFPENYRESLWTNVIEVRNSVMEMKTGYMNAHSAQDVIENFSQDLHSNAYQELGKRLKMLNLPTFFDIQPGFEQLAGKLDLQ